MERIRTAAIFISFAASAGCDIFYGPVLSNTYETAIETTVVYSDGYKKTDLWEPCRGTLFGKGDDAGDRIEKIVFRKDGAVLHRLNADQIQQMLTTNEQSDVYYYWSVGPDGIAIEEYDSTAIDTSYCRSRR